MTAEAFSTAEVADFVHVNPQTIHWEKFEEGGDLERREEREGGQREGNGREGGEEERSIRERTKGEIEQRDKRGREKGWGGVRRKER